MIRLISSNVASKVVAAIADIEPGSGHNIHNDDLVRLQVAVNLYDLSSMLFNINKEPLNE